ncbi:MAG TPA: 6-carboxytetrahydropterin synthase [Candidatus Dormibacteraeota bacterium]|jgi:6-pyruvoyltetrahydropterin/6-carboxytetrahydropterin synthase|nr:6-carboxytetrahydropterin synthase [Candidatus Dormibacteraeota bacterium]
MPPDPDAARARRHRATLVVDKESIGFAAAHFSVLEGGSESLHGHNYRVAVRATGGVRADGTVVDFAALKSAVRAACAELDHRMLVPTESPAVSVTVVDDEVELREGSRRFVFPRSDVCLLPVVNTTCECLAGHVLVRLRQTLQDLDVGLEVTVEESPGQGATVAEDGPQGEP